MKKLSNIFVLLAIAITSLSLTSCNSEDDLNTDQYGNGISLTSFGPCPVLRGGTLHFLGSNLDQIVEVDLPDADPITSIEVIKSGKDSEITIQVPAEKCGEGIITLKTNKGGELQTVTPITYREDIVLEGFYVGTEGNLVGNVGQTVTIKGDYLNLLHGVIFADNDTVSEESFLTHDRYTIEVAIPKEAKTGRLTLTDLATTPNEIQTDEALTVNLPTVTSLSPENLKAGATLTVKGASLDQIESVELQGATVAAEDLTISADGTTLSFALPATATDGEVELVTYSGVKVAAGSITTVVPTELVASPSPVKNGADVTVSGKDLDLVTAIAFEGASAASLKSVAEDKVVAEVPETAKSGNITLTLANGKTVTVEYTTVVPTNITFTPSEFTAGEKLVIKGNDLDLVASVTFPGDADITVSEFTAQTETAIGLTTPAAAYGSKVTLTLKNGESVEATGLTIKAATDPAVTATNNSGIAGKSTTVEGKNFNNVESVYIGETKVTRFSDRSNTSMTFTVPETCAVGTYDFIMVDYDGKSFTVGTFTVESEEIDLTTVAFNQSDQSQKFTFPCTLAWDDSGRFRINRDSGIDFSTKNLVAGKSLLKIYKSGTGQAQINNANWSSFYTLSDWNGDQDVLQDYLTQDMIDWLLGTQTDGWSNTAWIIQGDGMTVSKITILP